MQTRTLSQKLKSTKLWAMIAGVVVGVAIYLGADADTIQTVAGAVTALASVITYIVTEGKVDFAAVSQTIEIIGNAVEALEDGEEDEGKPDA